MNEREKAEVRRINVETVCIILDKAGKWIVIGLVLGGFTQLDILKAILEALTK